MEVSFMSKLRTTILVTLVIFATILCLLVQFVIGINATILNPNYYINIMQKHNLYDLPQNYVLLSIKNESNNLLSEPICKSLTPAINTAFSNDWAKYQSEKFITNTIDYIKGNQEDLQLQIPLKDRKVILKGELINFLESKYTPDELASFQIISPVIIANAIVASTNLPDSVNVLNALNFSQNGFNKVVDELKHYYQYISLAPYLLFLLISCLVVYIGRGLGLKWIGNSILIAGFLTILLASISSVLLDEQIINNVTKKSELLFTIGINPLILVSIFKNTIIGSMNKIALTFCLLGVLLFISGNLWIRKSKDKPFNIPS